jgi:UDP-N-acetylmuramate dehydrogenase
MPAVPTALRLAPHTTLRLGGPARRLVTGSNADEIVQSLRAAEAAGEPTLVLGGGSNVVVADDGFPGTVILNRSVGIRVIDTDAEAVTVRVEAGTDWDEVVATAVAEGWSGLECLSGIPGSAGATPIQNVSAYGQEVADSLTALSALDRHHNRVVTMRATECGFGYRTSVFRRSRRWVVLATEFRLRRSHESAPVRYPELARRLRTAVGSRAPLAEVRRAVLDLRAGKGMVLDPADPDTYSAGSFFLNPVLDPAAWRSLRSRTDGEPPSWPAGDGLVKVSAAWLIEQAGFRKGYGRRGVAISSKHSLALTNRGTGSTGELLALAREIRGGVRASFGVTLHPEPVLIGCAM